MAFLFDLVLVTLSPSPLQVLLFNTFSKAILPTISKLCDTYQNQILQRDLILTIQ